MSFMADLKNCATAKVAYGNFLFIPYPEDIRKWDGQEHDPTPEDA